MIQPNIVLVVLDTARADALGAYGAGAGATPALDALGHRGTVVRHAVAPAPWTLPSHAAMFTGRLPRSLGLGQAPSETVPSVAPVLAGLGDLLLPEVLRRAGYATVGVSCNLWISPASGFDTGFDEFSYLPSPRPSNSPEQPLVDRLRWYAAALRAHHDDGAKEAARLLADRFERRDPDRPFFWFVNLNECHSPYLPPRPHSDVGPVGRLRAARDAERYQTLPAFWRYTLTDAEVPAPAVRRMRHLYARSVARLDDWIDGLVALLTAGGVIDDTVVVVTSDHGENFGEGGLYGHGFSLDDRLVRVPLVASGPVTLPDGPLSLTALPAVLADAAGLADHPYGPVPTATPAVSQADPLTDRDDPRIARIVRDWGADEHAVRLLTEPLTCATDGRLKLLRHGDREAVYELDTDPLELSPRDPARHGTDELAPLRAALDDERVWEEPDLSDGTDATVPQPDPDEVARIEEQMRLLGYL